MAFAFVSGNVGTNPGSAVTTSGSFDSTGATCAFIGVIDNIASAVVISDSKSNAWILDASVSLNGNRRASIYRSNLATVGAGHTVTATMSGQGSTLGVGCYSGGAVAVDKVSAGGSNNATAGVTVDVGGSVTPSFPNELLIAVAGSDGSTSLYGSVDSSFTLRENQGANGNNFATALADQIQTTATARNPTFTNNNNVVHQVAIMVTYYVVQGSGILSWSGRRAALIG